MLECAVRAPIRSGKRRERGEWLSPLLEQSLAGMITLLDPEAIVIGGGVAKIGKPLFDKIRATIPHHTINLFAKKTPVLAAKLQTNVGIFGAASVFLPHE